MKKGINFLIIIILALVIILGGTACMKSPEEIESSGNSTGSGQSSKTSNPVDTIEFTDKQIIEAILTEYYESKEDGANESDMLMSRAEKLIERFLGRITSEEDAKEKAEVVWMEIDKEMIEDIKEKHGNEKQPYIEASFYEKYDVWFVRTRLSGVTEDGRSYGSTGGCQLIIRNSDGKVLGVW